MGMPLMIKVNASMPMMRKVAFIVATAISTKSRMFPLQNLHLS